MRLSASSIDAYQTCPRLYQITRLQKQRETETYQAAVGTLFHAWQETWDGVTPPTWDTPAANADEAVARGLCLAYFDQHLGTVVERLGAEMPFSVDFGTHTITGKIDGVWRVDSETCVVEHKTTGMDLSKFLPMKAFDRQTTLYPLAAQSLGFNVDYVLLDMVHRPLIKKYDNYSHLTERVREGAVCRREKLYRTARDYEALVADLDGIVKQMELEVYPRNPTACFKYGRMCDFHSTCSNG